MTSPSQGEALGLSGQDCVSLAGDTGQAAAMDEAHFRLFYEQTARPLWAYLARVSGSRDQADDLLQESYCRFLAARLPEMEPAHRKNYLFRIATNLLRDGWRRSEPVTDGETPEKACDDQLESRADVRRGFEQLKARERQLLWLAYVEGSDHQEIARITGLRVASIKMLLFRARRRLAEVLRRRVEHVAEVSR
jgi:RNA polymerase sigma-70 factor (ECF subfamily)